MYTYRLEQGELSIVNVLIPNFRVYRLPEVNSAQKPLKNKKEV